MFTFSLRTTADQELALEWVREFGGREDILHLQRLRLEDCWTTFGLRRAVTVDFWLDYSTGRQILRWHLTGDDPRVPSALRIRLRDYVRIFGRGGRFRGPGFDINTVVSWQAIIGICSVPQARIVDEGRPRRAGRAGRRRRQR